MPIKLHVLGFGYLGCGTNYDLKQEKGIKPANKLDGFIMNRDKFYSEKKDLKKTKKLIMYCKKVQGEELQLQMHL